MKRWGSILTGALLTLSLNSLYLAARADANLFYFANVLLHVLLGLGAAAGLAVLARHRWNALGGLWRAAAMVFSAGALLGVLLTITGATRPFRPLLYAHIVLVALGALLALVAGIRHAIPAGGPARAVATASGLLALASPGVRATADLFPPRYHVANPQLPPLTMDGEGQGRAGPFFPSSAETNVGGVVSSAFFLKSRECARCHAEIYRQWESSAHHFSSFNNQWYRKSIEYMQDVIGTKPSRWCAGCHDHALLFAGKFDTPIRGRTETLEAQAGIACTSCHSIVGVKSTMGQGDFTLEYPPLHDLATSDDPLLRTGHDFLLKLDPGPHARTFLRSFHTSQTPEFCSSCHKVHLDVPVNGYRWIRGFNEYDNWQASGVSGQGARSFYYPPKPQKCADCHMPMVPANDPAAHGGLVHSHRFPGANTALPYVNQDEEQLRAVQAFLSDKQVTLDVFGLVRTAAPPPAHVQGVQASEPRLSSTFAMGEESTSPSAPGAVLSEPLEVIAPLDKADAALRRGDSVRLEVVVRTRKVGHFFPGGTVDAFDVWVELEVTDSNGKRIFHSGFLEDSPPGRGRGPVEPGAHFYRSLQLDEHGNPINKRNAWATRSVAYVRLIPPGAADTVHYRLRIPEDCGDHIVVKAKLNYRKFAWWNTQWAFAGARDPSQASYSLGPDHDDGRWVFTGDTSTVSGKMKAIPDIPITVMARAEARIRILPKGAPEPRLASFKDRSVRERWNDYGIGLLLQGDLKGAEAAFLEVTRMEPTYADGWVNVGRARLQEGDLAGAEQALGRALAVDPNLAKTRFFLGSVLKGEGRYDEALSHLRLAAAEYPRDRVVCNEIGRTLFLKRQYREAITELSKVLAIDPEDLQAHYNLMLSYQGAGDAEMAKKHEALYRRFKADEAAQEITGPYRRLHPEDNNERQAVHEHVSALDRLTPRPAPVSYGRPPSARAAIARSEPRVAGGGGPPRPEPSHAMGRAGPRRPQGGLAVDGPPRSAPGSVVAGGER
jgi:tetratricopeptide (TPR) repeat protein